MNAPLVSVRIDDRRRQYRAGEVLCGELRIESWRSEDIKGVELSVIWRTEGKGEEDVGLHYFRRYSREDAEGFDPRGGVRFASDPLPPSPLSYEGVILKIRWYVRVRLFLSNGEALVHDEPFRLGSVPPPMRPEDE